MDQSDDKKFTLDVYLAIKEEDLRKLERDITEISRKAFRVCSTCPICVNELGLDEEARFITPSKEECKLLNAALNEKASLEREIAGLEMDLAGF